MRTPAELREAYEEGATVEELRLEEGVHERVIRKLLKEAGTTMRAPGQRPGKPHDHKQVGQGTPGSRPTAGTFRPGAHQAHRRRGWK